MNFDYDIVIIGAGPIGSTIAYYLSKKGLNVSIVEKKKQIGYPLQCAGILSKNIYQYNDLPDEVILNTVKGAFLHSKNHILNVKKEDDAAYVIDRISYDQFLLERAVKNNTVLITQKAIDFDVENGITYLSNKKQIKSKIIIGCDGYNSQLSKSMGNQHLNFHASQFLVEIDSKSMNLFRKSQKNVNDYVDVYALNEVLPGFLWIIPIKNNQYRIGLFSNDTHKNQNEFLNKFLCENFKFEILDKYKGFIPIFNEKNQIVKKRAILIGDAASQVKPTSGGGLLIGFDACKLACKHIIKAINNDNLNELKNYQKVFNDKYVKEFNYQFKVHKTLNLLSDDDLDYLFSKLKQYDCENIISEYGDMDTQSILIKEFIKRGLIFKILPNFLFKKIINIFGFR